MLNLSRFWRAIVDVARGLGLVEQTLGNWGDRAWCCAGDEGLVALRRRPTGEASNHLMLRCLKTVVVSDEEKAQRMRQVGPGRRARANR
jgi:hypothetical protein